MNDSLSCVLRERCIRRFGHVCRMDDGQLLKKLLFGKLILFMAKTMVERC